LNFNNQKQKEGGFPKPLDAQIDKSSFLDINPFVPSENPTELINDLPTNSNEPIQIDEDGNDSEDEGIEDYKLGGYHPVHIGYFI